MKKAAGYLKLGILVVFIALASCSSDDSSSNDNNGDGGVQPSAGVLTLDAKVTSTNVVTLGGYVGPVDGRYVINRGVCWSTSPDPVVDLTAINYKYDPYFDQNSQQTGGFEIDFGDTFKANTTYYFRIFVVNNTNGYEYGNVLSFTTGGLITTLAATYITTTTAILNSIVGHNGSEPVSSGYVYSASPNPTVEDDEIIRNYPYTANNLTPNTIYYVKAFVDNPDGEGYIYGEEMQFRTAGYAGPAGGVVAFDKGYVADGWQYLEVSPTSLDYNGTGGSFWGGYGINFTVNVMSIFGTGLQNSTNIVAAIPSDPNCAARLCMDLELNGYSDWFLASVDEMFLIAQSVAEVGVQVGDHAWTSTLYAYQPQYGQTIEYNYATTTGYSKRYADRNSTAHVYPVRRY